MSAQFSLLRTTDKRKYSSRKFKRFCLCPTVVSFSTHPNGIVLSRFLATERFLFRVTLNEQNTPVKANQRGSRASLGSVRIVGVRPSLMAW